MVGFESQLSIAIGNANCAAAKAAESLHSIIVSNEPAAVVQLGAVLSNTVIVCLNGVLVFPQASVTVQVLV